MTAFVTTVTAVLIQQPCFMHNNRIHMIPTKYDMTGKSNTKQNYYSVQLGGKRNKAQKPNKTVNYHHLQ